MPLSRARGSARALAQRGTSPALVDALLCGAGRGTREHSREVAELAVAIGHRLGLDRAERALLKAAARLHDIGKIEIPASVVDKPGPLTKMEWNQIYRHTVIGERLAAELGERDPIPRFVRSSHERWDGGGYPDGLRGEEIPLVSRIISCADAFDAICSHRPYRAARDPMEALAEIRRCAYTQFDPTVVSALGEIVEPAMHAAPRMAGHRPRSGRRAAAAIALCALSVGVTVIAGIALQAPGPDGAAPSRPAAGGATLNRPVAAGPGGLHSSLSGAGQVDVAGAVASGRGLKVTKPAPGRRSKPVD